MTKTKFKHAPTQPKSEMAMTAFYILCSAHEASSSFLDLFKKVRKTRAARGTPTDEEHDLLRAMLLFSTSGLDSMIKQLFADALPSVIDTDDGANEMFKTHAEKRIRKGEIIDYKFLAGIITDKAPRYALISDLINSLRGSSLQSKEQLLKAIAHFNIPTKDIAADMDLLDKIFKARNQITHEMDIDFKQPNRSRRPRRRDDMIKFVEEVFRIAECVLKAVDRRLPECS
jgi:hypothetical protein